MVVLFHLGRPPTNGNEYVNGHKHREMVRK